MKKPLIWATIVALIVGSNVIVTSPAAMAMTLRECLSSKNVAFGSVLERAPIAAKHGIFQYRGTAAQNIALTDAICNDQMGYGVVTDYQKALATPMTSAQSFVPVTSLTLKDGTVLSMSVLGSVVYLTLEPGATNEEIVACTGINATAKYFTGCTRGLPFSGNTVVAVSANQKTHSSGSTVVISNVHYVYNQYLDTSSSAVQTLSGVYTFGNYPVMASPTTVPTSTGQLATKYYVDNVGAGGFTASNVSSTRGLSVDGSVPERVGVNASTTQIGFNSSGQMYVIPYFYNSITSTGNNAFHGTQLFDATSTFTGQVYLTSASVTATPSSTTDVVNKAYADGLYFGNGADGAVTISAGTSTLSRDMFYSTLTVNSGGYLVTNGYKIFAKTSVTINSGGWITATGTNGLAGSGSSDRAGGAGATTGTLGGGTAGGTGKGCASGTENAGVAATAISSGGLGNVGGTGGYANGGVDSGGTSSFTASTATSTLSRFAPFGNAFYDAGAGVVLKAGVGGGGGACYAAGAGPTSSGGSGGGGGGIVWISAPTVTNNGTIDVRGGNGGNGACNTNNSNSGGGGGGGGGACYIRYQFFAGTSCTATGGSAGSSATCGTAPGTVAASGGTGVTYFAPIF